MNGGFESTATVKSVELEYDIEKPWGTWKPTFDLFLTVTYKKSTQDFDETFEIFGNLKKELPITENKSWGSGFKVKTFFESVLNKRNLTLNEDYSIPESWLDEVIDKQFMLCSYPTNRLKDNGKNFWKVYQIVAPAGSPAGTLKGKVMKDFQAGYLKDAAIEEPDEFKSKESSPSVKPKVTTTAKVNDLDLDDLDI